ncbi:MAG: transporter substrate-binding domain-containing protein, partial [Acidaminococcaceae bacterium]|nr:transporter substrate-binding domain-containing protein [Acidaminococcaceae bacterium]
EDKIGIAVNKENTELLTKLDAELEKYRKTSSYKQLMRTYFGSIK